jgi:hypothetical protein
VAFRHRIKRPFIGISPNFIAFQLLSSSFQLLASSFQLLLSA